jgi:hypothetical protein
LIHFQTSGYPFLYIEILLINTNWEFGTKTY